jgi:hypothetical protein
MWFIDFNDWFLRLGAAGFSGPDAASKIMDDGCGVDDAA